MGERFRQSTVAGMRYAVIRSYLPQMLTTDYWDMRNTRDGRFAQAWQPFDDSLLENFPPAITAIDLGNGHVIRRSEACSAGVRPEDGLTWTLSDVDGYGKVFAEQCGMPWKPFAPPEE